MQDIDAMLANCPNVTLFSLRHLGNAMLQLRQQGLQQAHILAIMRSAPKVLTRSEAGAVLGLCVIVTSGQDVHSACRSLHMQRGRRCTCTARQAVFGRCCLARARFTQSWNVAW